ncbi:MAG: hypothetical protein ACREPF_08860, partial [Rhodanobacteraceae bacterium]
MLVARRTVMLASMRTEAAITDDRTKSKNRADRLPIALAAGIRFGRPSVRVPMKPGIQLRQSQQLSLTPQLQQAIRLLQLSQIELHTELRELAEANPLIDLDGIDGEEEEQAESSAAETANEGVDGAAREAEADSEYWDEHSPQVMEWAQSSRGFDD